MALAAIYLTKGFDQKDKYRQKWIDRCTGTWIQNTVINLSPSS